MRTMSDFPSSALFQVLYTTQLTQKRKKWHDGQCTFNFVKNKVKLSDEEGRSLAEDFWTTEGCELPEIGSQLKFDRFIVELDSLIVVKKVENSGHMSNTSASHVQLLRESLVNVPPLTFTSARKNNVTAWNIPDLSPKKAKRNELQSEMRGVVSKLGGSTHTGPAVAHPNMGPPLDDILKNDVGRIKASHINYDYSVSGIRKVNHRYAPWADPDAAISNQSNQESMSGSCYQIVEPKNEVMRHFPDQCIPGNDRICEKAPVETVHKSEIKLEKDADESFSDISREYDDHFISRHTRPVSMDDNPIEDHTRKLGRIDAILPVDEDINHIELTDESWEGTLTAPKSYFLESDLDSDIDSDIGIVDVAAARRNYSLFEDIPIDTSHVGPWTKEAYLLFSWHPPKVKQESV